MFRTNLIFVSLIKLSRVTIRVLIFLFISASYLIMSYLTLDVSCLCRVLNSHLSYHIVFYFVFLFSLLVLFLYWAHSLTHLTGPTQSDIEAQEQLPNSPIEAHF